jgi:hypothetical protein
MMRRSASVVAPILFPHSAQNLAPAGASVAQRAQETDRECCLSTFSLHSGRSRHGASDDSIPGRYEAILEKS